MKKNKGKKGIIRKLIYLILFGLIIFAFIYISNKYEKLSEQKTIVFTDYYKNESSDYYDVINANELIAYLKKGNHLIFIGSSSSKWSQEYASLLTKIAKELKIKMSYYDLENDKTQKNSKYYELKEVLKGNLITTDGSNSNILSPSFYIIKDGKVKYYNIDTIAMKNKEEPKEYWNKKRREEFNMEIKNNIEKYYLNN